MVVGERHADESGDLVTGDGLVADPHAGDLTGHRTAGETARMGRSIPAAFVVASRDIRGRKSSRLPQPRPTRA